MSAAATANFQTGIIATSISTLLNKLSSDALTEASAPAPASTGFIDLINLLLGAAEPAEANPAPPQGVTRSPQLVADALIRSMLGRSGLNSPGGLPTLSTGLPTAGKSVVQSGIDVTGRKEVVVGSSTMNATIGAEQGVLAPAPAEPLVQNDTPVQNDIPVQSYKPVHNETFGDAPTLSAPSSTVQPVAGRPLPIGDIVVDTSLVPTERPTVTPLARITVMPKSVDAGAAGRKERGVPSIAPLEALLTMTPSASPVITPRAPSVAGPQVQNNASKDDHQPVPEGHAVGAASPKPLPKAELAFGLRLTPIDVEISAATGGDSSPAVSVSNAVLNIVPETVLSETVQPETVAPELAPTPPPVGSQPLAAQKEGRPKSLTATQTLSAEINSRPSTGPGGDLTPVVTAVAAIASAGDHSGSFARTLEIAAPPTGASFTGPSEHAAQTAAEALRASETTAAPDPTLPTTPAQGIGVRIAMADAPTVDVHITDRGGQVQVAVRTSDPGLQSSLRQDLGTLVNSVERTGYRVEALTPREGVPQSSASLPAQDSGSGEPGNSPGKHSSGNQDAEQPSQPQQQGQQRRQRNRSPQNWIATMENTI